MMSFMRAPRWRPVGGPTHRRLSALGICRSGVPGWHYTAAAGSQPLRISGMHRSHLSKYRSRGHLVTEFLRSTESPIDYLNAIDTVEYAGFNLLVSDGATLAWLSNHGGPARILPPEIYRLSNALLDSPWHKVMRSKLALENLIQRDKINASELFRLLDDRGSASVAEVESSHLPFQTAHAASAPFIVLPDYGTRSSSVVLLDSAGSWRFSERRFDADGDKSGESVFTFVPDIHDTDQA